MLESGRCAGRQGAHLVAGLFGEADDGAARLCVSDAAVEQRHAKPDAAARAKPKTAGAKLDTAQQLAVSKMA